MIHILVVEDDKAFNHVVCKHRNINNYRAVCCLNPSEAYGRLDAERYDLIISDIKKQRV